MTPAPKDDEDPYIDIDIYGRGFDAVHGPGAFEAGKRECAERQLKTKNQHANMQMGDFIERDLYGRGDPRIFGAGAHLRNVEEAEANFSNNRERKKAEKGCISLSLPCLRRRSWIWKRRSRRSSTKSIPVQVEDNLPVPGEETKTNASIQNDENSEFRAAYERKRERLIEALKILDTDVPKDEFKLHVVHDNTEPSGYKARLFNVALEKIDDEENLAVDRSARRHLSHSKSAPTGPTSPNKKVSVAELMQKFSINPTPSTHATSVQRLRSNTVPDMGSLRARTGIEQAEIISGDATKKSKAISNDDIDEKSQTSISASVQKSEGPMDSASISSENKDTSSSIGKSVASVSTESRRSLVVPVPVAIYRDETSSCESAKSNEQRSIAPVEHEPQRASHGGNSDQSAANLENHSSAKTAATETTAFNVSGLRSPSSGKESASSHRSKSTYNSKLILDHEEGKLSTQNSAAYSESTAYDVFAPGLSASSSRISNERCASDLDRSKSSEPTAADVFGLDSGPSSSSSVKESSETKSRFLQNRSSNNTTATETTAFDVFGLQSTNSSQSSCKALCIPSSHSTQLDKQVSNSGSGLDKAIEKSSPDSNGELSESTAYDLFGPGLSASSLQMAVSRSDSGNNSRSNLSNSSNIPTEREGLEMRDKENSANSSTNASSSSKGNSRDRISFPSVKALQKLFCSSSSTRKSTARSSRSRNTASRSSNSRRTSRSDRSSNSSKESKGRGSEHLEEMEHLPSTVQVRDEHDSETIHSQSASSVIGAKNINSGEQASVSTSSESQCDRAGSNRSAHLIEKRSSKHQYEQEDGMVRNQSAGSSSSLRNHEISSDEGNRRKKMLSRSISALQRKFGGSSSLNRLATDSSEVKKERSSSSSASSRAQSETLRNRSVHSIEHRVGGSKAEKEASSSSTASRKRSSSLHASERNGQQTSEQEEGRSSDETIENRKILLQEELGGSSHTKRSDSESSKVKKSTSFSSKATSRRSSIRNGSLSSGDGHEVEREDGAISVQQCASVRSSSAASSKDPSEPPNQYRTSDLFERRAASSEPKKPLSRSSSNSLKQLRENASHNGARKTSQRPEEQTGEEISADKNRSFKSDQSERESDASSMKGSSQFSKYSNDEFRDDVLEKQLQTDRNGDVNKTEEFVGESGNEELDIDRTHSGAILKTLSSTKTVDAESTAFDVFGIKSTSSSTSNESNGSENHSVQVAPEQSTLLEVEGTELSDDLTSPDERNQASSKDESELEEKSSAIVQSTSSGSHENTGSPDEASDSSLPSSDSASTSSPTGSKDATTEAGTSEGEELSSSPEVSSGEFDGREEKTKSMDSNNDERGCEILEVEEGSNNSSASSSRFTVKRKSTHRKKKTVPVDSYSGSDDDDIKSTYVPRRRISRRPSSYASSYRASSSNGGSFHYSASYDVEEIVQNARGLSHRPNENEPIETQAETEVQSELKEINLAPQEENVRALTEEAEAASPMAQTTDPASVEKNAAKEESVHRKKNFLENLWSGMTKGGKSSAAKRETENDIDESPGSVFKFKEPVSENSSLLRSLRNVLSSDKAGYLAPASATNTDPGVLHGDSDEDTYVPDHVPISSSISYSRFREMDEREQERIAGTSSSFASPQQKSPSTFNSAFSPVGSSPQSRIPTGGTFSSGFSSAGPSDFTQNSNVANCNNTGSSSYFTANSSNLDSMSPVVLMTIKKCTFDNTASSSDEEFGEFVTSKDPPIDASNKSIEVDDTRTKEHAEINSLNESTNLTHVSLGSSLGSVPTPGQASSSSKNTEGSYYSEFSPVQAGSNWKRSSVRFTPFPADSVSPIAPATMQPGSAFSSGGSSILKGSGQGRRGPRASVRFAEKPGSDDQNKENENPSTKDSKKSAGSSTTSGAISVRSMNTFAPQKEEPVSLFPAVSVRSLNTFATDDAKPDTLGNVSMRSMNAFDAPLKDDPVSNALDAIQESGNTSEAEASNDSASHQVASKGSEAKKSSLSASASTTSNGSGSMETETTTETADQNEVSVTGLSEDSASNGAESVDETADSSGVSTNAGSTGDSSDEVEFSETGADADTLNQSEDMSDNLSEASWVMRANGRLEESRRQRADTTGRRTPIPMGETGNNQ